MKRRPLFGAAFSSEGRAMVTAPTHYSLQILGELVFGLLWLVCGQLGRTLRGWCSAAVRMATAASNGYIPRRPFRGRAEQRSPRLRVEGRPR
jgi:hypothetical protein